MSMANPEQIYKDMSDPYNVIARLRQENEGLRKAIADIKDNPRVMAIIERYAPGTHKLLEEFTHRDVTPLLKRQLIYQALRDFTEGKIPESPCCNGCLDQKWTALHERICHDLQLER